MRLKALTSVYMLHIFKSFIRPLTKFLELFKVNISLKNEGFSRVDSHNNFKQIFKKFLPYTPPKDWRFQPHKDWRYLWQVATENCYTNQHREKIPIESFDPPKTTISPAQGEYPCKDFFLEKSISPIVGQSLEAPQHRAHIQVKFKTQSPHTPQHRVHT